FAAIGVRDATTEAFVRWLEPSLEPEWVPDPTFSANLLADVDREKLRRKLESFGVDFSRPRAGLVAGNREATAFAAHKFRALGYKTVGFSIPNGVSDVELFGAADLSPIEWAAALGEMDLCLTERMHGCIFCILGDTPFIGIDLRQT